MQGRHAASLRDVHGTPGRDKPWSTQDIEGVYRFLQRTWRLFIQDAEETAPEQPARFWSPMTSPPPKISRSRTRPSARPPRTSKRCASTAAISQFMIFVNHFTKAGRRPRCCMPPFVQLLARLRRILAEELWQQLGETASLTYAKWPVFDPEPAPGRCPRRRRGSWARRAAASRWSPAPSKHGSKSWRALCRGANQLTGKTVRKVIFVKDKIINFVIA